MAMVVPACAKDDDTDDQLADPTSKPPVEQPDDDDRRDQGSLPPPSTSSSGSSKPSKDGGGGGSSSGDAAASSGGSSGSVEPECADDNDTPDSIGEIEFPDAYTEVKADDQTTKELKGVVGDYFDYDYFGFDVYRNASNTVFPFTGERPFPANTEICVFVQCFDGEPTSFTCDAGEEATDFGGDRGCCSVSSAVSLYYATCDGTDESYGDNAFVFVRVTPNDENICSVPYTVRAAFN